VRFTVTTARGGARRVLEGTLVAPDRTVVAGGTIRNGTARISASRLVCPISGRYFFFASTTDAGAATQLLGTLSVATKRAGKAVLKNYPPGATTTVEIGALPGSTATLRFSGDKRATLVAKVVSVTDPNGVPVPPLTLATLIKATPTGGTLTLPTPVGGTWSIVLGATAQSATPGRLSWSYVIKQLKGAVYSAE
jgi:hypothetical protein